MNCFIILIIPFQWQFLFADRCFIEIKSIPKYLIFIFKQILMLSSNSSLTKGRQNQSFKISSQGLQSMLQKNISNQYPGRHVSWTDDIRVELPIRISQSRVGSLQPTTLIDQFRENLTKFSQHPALSVKRNGKWVTLNYKQYYEQCMQFAASLIAYKFAEHTSINIIGFNSPQWAISFFGSLFARCLPTGVYTTNSQKVCEYIVQNSDCKIVVAENMEYATRYLQRNEIQLIILYNDEKVDLKTYNQRIVHWKDYLKQGHRVDIRFVQQRMNKSKPGNCATLVYTSGTTGMPKGVMLSHDNLSWTKRSMDEYYQRQDYRMRIVSYLPLSHIAGLFSDIIVSLMNGYHVFFANPDALQGSLVETIVQVRPNAFFSVPRVWEKIYEKMQTVAKQNGWLKTKIAGWAKGIGPEGTVQQRCNAEVNWQFRLAKTLVYNQVKKRLGLDQCQYFLYGAAPLDPIIRQYFLSLNIFLINTYGMSQSTGPQNFTNPYTFDYKDLKAYKQVGNNIPGTQIKIIKTNDLEDDGQICFRGRNIFMGYYKKPKETSQVLDSQGFLHSGDLGKIDSDNVLFITGRAKQLIITAGGQNIPPVLIQNEIKTAMPFIANVIVVGEARKYLTCLMSLKQDPPASGIIEKSAKQYLSLKGIQISTISQARNHPIFHKLVTQGLKAANSKAISKAQNVQDYYLLPEDFSVDNGLLTPTLKLKRNQVTKKYADEIQKMYIIAKM